MSTEPQPSGAAAFRKSFRARIEAPVARVFMRTGLSPNALTLIGFGIAIVGSALAASQVWVIAGLVVGFGAAFDLFDGALARATGKTSKLGAFMDSVFDRMGEAVVYVGCCWACLSVDYELGAILSCAAMATAFMVSYTRAKSESLGFSSGVGLANVGLAPREVRSVILVVGLIATGFAGGLVLDALGNTAGPIVISATMGLISVLAALTTIQRILYVYRQSESTKQEVTR